MSKNDLKLLDCTLRDGGYVNDWKWGFQNAKAIIRFLTKAKVDFVEVGFLRNIDGYNEDVTVCNTIEELNRLLPKKTGETVYSAMAMRSNYDINNLSPYSGQGIEMIRITAHDYDIEEGMDFAQAVKEKGYKLSINPINIMGYSDERILWIIDQVNEIKPYQFSIVDTFGSMKRRDLDRIVSLVDHNLDRDIRVALHLHENMALSCCLAQNFIDKHLNRPVAVDASLLGMGRVPGNLPIELIADYCNDYADKAYDIDYLMDAIQDYIAPIKGEPAWGYTPAYFLSARFNLHRNYAEHYLEKGDLTNRDINHILAGFDRTKATAFDVSYADRKYLEYKNNIIDDSSHYEELKSELTGKNILVLAPGASFCEQKDKIEEYIKKKKPITISVNFMPEYLHVDYAFFSNSKRYFQAMEGNCKTITTSNIKTSKSTFRLGYNLLSGAFSQGNNSFVMLLKLLHDFGIKKIVAAGADGFKDGRDNYSKLSFPNSSYGMNKGNTLNYNASVKKAIQQIGIAVEYLTDSEYRNV
jgi:hypothetical protein